MAGKDSFNNNDPLDISELAALNNDISPEFIEQLQNRLSQNSDYFDNTEKNISNDGDLFEEVNTSVAVETEEVEEDVGIEFKAEFEEDSDTNETSIKTSVETEENTTENTEEASAANTGSSADIENLTNGNITEKPINKEQIKYNESLDYIDGNVKYSKYVIYIAPENKDFIESLTVKERKNLINRILREQDDITITKRRLGLINAVIKHAVIAILTLAISIPTIYIVINSSLETSINNYKRSEKIFQTLYREKGRIQKR
ncbi:MAG: hypothetical protein E7Z89_07875 [Cyanobacteria bacterium SIG28]|nr:hypothetical protein [Cyanobacteria bacterium SIG28]